MPLITLTTDFGQRDSYVAQMKGVILEIAPAVQLVDVTHAIPPQDIDRGAAILEEIAAVFPAGSVHVAVVDPGVGSARALLAVEAAGQRFLAPDNGLLTLALRRFTSPRIYRLSNDRFWRQPVSATFHGRDILAPVAAHWSLGAEPTDFGPALDAACLVTLPGAAPQRVAAGIVGRIESIDAFGNLITNVRETDLPGESRGGVSIALGGCDIAGISRCYADRPAGSLLALIGSSGRLEIAVNGGSAAKELNISRGAELLIKPVGS